jgi:2-amino-4-hydroxy-6-hydroxymethyldihydropteridine diphosphokinase
MGHTIFLGFGSNLGDRRRHQQEAKRLVQVPVEVILLSSVYDTAPMLVTDQPRFLNMACSARTALSPEELLAQVKFVESKLGRVSGPRYGPRVIDVDLLLYDDLVFESPTLTIPHPRILERAFVLVPLAEIAPALEHPVAHRTMASLANDCSGTDVVKLGPLFTPDA